MEINLEILTYLLVIVIVLLTVWIIRLENRISDLVSGRDGRSLESSIKHIKTGLENFDRYKHKTDQRLKTLETKARQAVRGINTIRFNPFKGTGGGGNQSFATTFLNEQGDGVVITSIYSRERVGIYSKPLNNFDSSHELSQEEKRSLSGAKEQIW